ALTDAAGRRPEGHRPAAAERRGGARLSGWSLRVDLHLRIDLDLRVDLHLRIDLHLRVDLHELRGGLLGIDLDGGGRSGPRDAEPHAERQPPGHPRRTPRPTAGTGTFTQYILVSSHSVGPLQDHERHGRGSPPAASIPGMSFGT